MKTEQIKAEIKKSYGSIALSQINTGCCSETACCDSTGADTMAENYDGVEGYFQEANLSLGCGLPTEIANIKEGDTVIDLGSGAGNDAFVARSIVGETGKVIGIDITPEMISRAKLNTEKLGLSNVEFILSDVEDMHLISNGSADVVISNCVMNLVPDKEKAYNEVFRVSKTGGHFSISDIVYSGTLPGGVLEAAELHAGCIAGAVEKGKYLEIIKSAGFKNLQIFKERRIELSDNLLLKYISQEELANFKTSGSGIYSITVYADKLEINNCCESTDNCCDTTAGSCCTTEEYAKGETSDCCNTNIDNSVSSCCN